MRKQSRVNKRLVWIFLLGYIECVFTECLKQLKKFFRKNSFKKTLLSMSFKIELGFIFFISPKIILKQNLKILRLKKTVVSWQLNICWKLFCQFFYTLQKDFCSFDSTYINIFYFSQANSNSILHGSRVRVLTKSVPYPVKNESRILNLKFLGHKPHLGVNTNEKTFCCMKSLLPKRSLAKLLNSSYW
jgi:hypothetical protein